MGMMVAWLALVSDLAELTKNPMLEKEKSCSDQTDRCNSL
jgi:hypothetical protein